MQLSEQLSRAFSTVGRYVTQDEGGLSRADFGVLVRLADRVSTRPGDLAAAEGLDPSTMSRRIASLHERGLIDRAPDPDDGRATVVSLSAAGQDALRAERDRRIGVITDALHDWEDSDRAELGRLLTKLADTLEDRRSTR